jgi:hypothetical protein
MGIREWDPSLLAFDEVALPDVVIPRRSTRDVHSPTQPLANKDPLSFLLSLFKTPY